MSLFKLIPVAAACLLLQGCVGVGWMTKESATFRNPSISTYKDADSVREGGHSAEYTTSWLQSHWGAPTSVRPAVSGSGELWTYQLDRCWCGVVVMAVIPIPLLLPVGHETVEFSIDNDAVVNAKRVENRGGGFGFGLAGPDGPWAAAEF